MLFNLHFKMASKPSVILLYCLVVVAGATVSSKDKPCSVYEGDSGYVCVCNATYCDTISAPSRLGRGRYYHYHTSATQPGFHVKRASFHKAATTSAADYTIVVNSSETYQTFKGLGAGISDSTVYDFDFLSAGSQTNLIESLFGGKGIELVIGRVPIGCTDFSLNYYTYDETPDDVDMTDFNLTSFDVTSKIPMIQMAYNLSSRGLSLLGASWTTPSWMKDNDDFSPGLIIPRYAKAYAKYLIKFLDAYKKYGLEFWGLSEGNELIMAENTHFRMPNVVMFPAQARVWTRDYLGPMLEEAGYGHVTLIAMDDERSYLTWYSERMLSDPKTAQYIDGFAVHWYGDSDRSTGDLDNFHSNYPDKFLIMTEASVMSNRRSSLQQGNQSIALGSWSDAGTIIEDMLQNFDHWVSGWVTWNAALNTDGGPDKQMSLNAPIIIDTSNDTFYKQPTFYAMGHFSKFIQPGAVRVGLTVQNTTSLYDLHEDRSTGGPGPQPPTRSPLVSTVSGVASVNPDGSTTVIIYNPMSSPAKLTVKDTKKGTLTTTVAANSLNSFVYW